MRSFNALGGPPSLLRNMSALGLGRPTPLQSHAVPVVASGSDLLASAPRGSGLTTALQQDFSAGSQFAFRMLLVGGALVAGLLVANVLVPPPLDVEPDSRLRAR